MPEPAATETTGRRSRGRPGHNRETVLRRAIDLFNRQGYDATSIGDLAGDLGVTKSAIYHHFDSKEALLASALDEALEGIGRAVDEAARANRDGSAYDRLRATVAAAVRILVEHQPAVTLLLRVRGNSEVEKSALKRRRRIDEQLASLVRQAAREGDLRSDVDPDLISRLTFGMVNSLVDWYRADGSISNDVLASSIASVLFDGLHASASPGH